jgi:hypothetical protein
MPWVQEAPVTRALDGSGATLSNGEPTRVEPGVDDAPLGAVSVGADWRTPSQATMLEVHDVISWCVASVPICPSSQPRVTRS